MVQTFMGLVSSKEGLLAARFFLGLAEAGLFPGRYPMIVSNGLHTYPLI